MTSPDYRALCSKLIDRWTKGKDYWSVLAEIQSALAYDPRNDSDYKKRTVVPGIHAILVRVR